MESAQLSKQICLAFEDAKRISNTESAKNSLLSRNKSESRFVAWNVLLGILACPPAARAEEAMRLFNWYWKIVANFFKGCGDWTAFPDEKFKSIADIPLEDTQMMYDIHADVIRTGGVLHGLYKPDEKRSIFRRIERILYTIAEFSPEMGYAQGFDRYVFILFYVASGFCKRNGLCDSFAESFAYSMTVRLLFLIRYHKFIRSEEEVLHWMRGYEELLDRFHPEISDYLSSSDINSVQYAFRWLALLFADEHNIEETLVLWDQCLIHANDIHSYMYCLAVAHVTQVYASKSKDREITESLQKFREWDFRLIIMDSIQYYEEAHSTVEKASCCDILSFLLRFF